MALGPLGRIVAQVVVVAGSAVGRAIVRAYKDAAQRGAVAGAASRSQSLSIRPRMSADEARKILGFEAGPGSKIPTKEEILSRYDRLFQINAPAGNFADDRRPPGAGRGKAPHRGAVRACRGAASSLRPLLIHPPASQIFVYVVYNYVRGGCTPRAEIAREPPRAEKDDQFHTLIDSAQILFCTSKQTMTVWVTRLLAASSLVILHASGHGLNRSGLQPFYCHQCDLPFTLKVCCRLHCERTIIRADEQLLVLFGDELAVEGSCENVVFINEQHHLVELGSVRLSGATTVR
ncbi:hypothetical protein Efla_003701 [Eimeria flavescens]